MIIAGKLVFLRVWEDPSKAKLKQGLKVGVNHGGCPVYMEVTDGVLQGYSPGSPMSLKP